MITMHTPGPWELDPRESSHVVSDDYHVIRAGCGFLAMSKECREQGFSIAGHMTIADALLITAAPALVKALDRLVHVATLLGADQDEGAALDQALKALADAGVTP